MVTIDHVVSSLKRMKDVRGAVVLLGAGGSKSAGIPLAGELMEEIEREFAPLPAGLPKTYADYMNFVPPGDRRTLLANHIDNARINWAHIALAQLIASGYVKCVLTTNFDPLIVRSCAMLGCFPAVYDFPSSKFFNPAEVVDPSIIYLHGQRTGFVMLNTKNETGRNPLDALFARAGEQRPWIVIGYSGNSDPVFERLASYERFDHRLFWIGYRDAPPSEHVSERLLIDGKYADYISGYDADSFFVSLAKKLGEFPPPLFGQPLRHLRETMAIVNAFDLPGHGGDLRELADKQTARAIELLEAESGQRAAMANALVVAGKYDQVLNEFGKEADTSPEIEESVAWGWVLKGLDAMDRAEADGVSPEEADKLLLEAIACDMKAVNARPAMADAYFNWGYALGARSKLKSGDEAKQLFEEARAKYAKARTLNSKDWEVYFNLGNLLGDRAEVVEDDGEAIALLREAISEYEAALKLKPKDSEVLTNLAATLKTLAGKVYDSQPILQQSSEAYAAAVLPQSFRELKANGAAVMIDWGEVLAELGEEKQAEAIWQEAELIERGSSAYNLAGLYAKRGYAERAKKWLLIARDAGTLPPIDDVKDDPDLSSLHDLDWFKDFTR